jgi:hypothetical protein
MTTTLQVSELNINGYVLSVTSRDGGDEPGVLEELTLRTIAAWLYIAAMLLKQKYVLDDDIGSVEQRYCAEHEMELPEKWGDPRVTVWDTYRGNHINFHLNSDDVPQVAIDTWIAQQSAIARIKAEYPESAPQAPPARSAPQNSTSAPIAPATPQAAVLVAQRAPTPNNPQYSDGQLVQFTVNKIVASTGQGTITYALWGAFPNLKYPLMTIFKNKKGSDENSVNYIAAKDTIVALGLSVDAGKIEATGNWQLIVKASHKDGKEYTNVVSLIAI